ncbi:hypothetical protein [Streptomyces boncukensis]|uniref:Uncharacterized protein n=1 Tax=Streptomyces boncukensis TaxID=2711219 RepID=A0A6G4WXB6_9ACTN|nr:hypothetical protein [Streptomyces boncukensis]NGO69164.1 hypothetical protein [Streptomyces boncukensis]
MPETNMPVTGPHRVYVRAIPAGVEIDVSAYVEDALRYLAAERPEDLAELIEVTASAAHQTSSGHADASAVHERDALAQDLSELVGPLTVYGAQAAQLAEWIGAGARSAMGGAA